VCFVKSVGIISQVYLWKCACFKYLCTSHWWQSIFYCDFFTF